MRSCETNASTAWVRLADASPPIPTGTKMSSERPEKTPASPRKASGNAAKVASARRRASLALAVSARLAGESVASGCASKWTARAWRALDASTAASRVALFARLAAAAVASVKAGRLRTSG